MSPVYSRNNIWSDNIYRCTNIDGNHRSSWWRYNTIECSRGQSRRIHSYNKW